MNMLTDSGSESDFDSDSEPESEITGGMWAGEGDRQKVNVDTQKYYDYWKGVRNDMLNVLSSREEKTKGGQESAFSPDDQQLYEKVAKIMDELIKNTAERLMGILIDIQKTKDDIDTSNNVIDLRDNIAEFTKATGHLEIIQETKDSFNKKYQKVQQKADTVPNVGKAIGSQYRKDVKDLERKIDDTFQRAADILKDAEKKLKSLEAETPKGEQPDERDVEIQTEMLKFITDVEEEVALREASIKELEKAIDSASNRSEIEAALKMYPEETTLYFPSETPSNVTQRSQELVQSAQNIGISSGEIKAFEKRTGKAIGKWMQLEDRAKKIKQDIEKKAPGILKDEPSEQGEIKGNVEENIDAFIKNAPTMLDEPNKILSNLRQQIQSTTTLAKLQEILRESDNEDLLNKVLDIDDMKKDTQGLVESAQKEKVPVTKINAFKKSAREVLTKFQKLAQAIERTKREIEAKRKELEKKEGEGGSGKSEESAEKQIDKFLKLASQTLDESNESLSNLRQQIPSVTTLAKLQEILSEPAIKFLLTEKFNINEFRKEQQKLVESARKERVPVAKIDAFKQSALVIGAKLNKLAEKIERIKREIEAKRKELEKEGSGESTEPLDIGEPQDEPSEGPMITAARAALEKRKKFLREQATAKQKKDAPQLPPRDAPQLPSRDAPQLPPRRLPTAPLPTITTQDLVENDIPLLTSMKKLMDFLKETGIDTAVVPLPDFQENLRDIEFGDLKSEKEFLALVKSQQEIIARFHKDPRIFAGLLLYVAHISNHVSLLDNTAPVTSTAPITTTTTGIESLEPLDVEVVSDDEPLLENSGDEGTGSRPPTPPPRKNGDEGTGSRPPTPPPRKNGGEGTSSGQLTTTTKSMDELLEELDDLASTSGLYGVEACEVDLLSSDEESF